MAFKGTTNAEVTRNHLSKNMLNLNEYNIVKLTYFSNHNSKRISPPCGQLSTSLSVCFSPNDRIDGSLSSRRAAVARTAPPTVRRAPASGKISGAQSRQPTPLIDRG